MTSKILCGWNVGVVIQFAVAGAIIGVIYKSSTPAASQIPKFMKRFVVRDLHRGVCRI